MKIAVIGYSGAGKSTLAGRLGARFGLPVLHLDKLHFAPGWVERADEEMRADLRAFLKNENWIIDGNYTRICSKERYEAADLIVMMDLGRIFCFCSALRRYFKYRGTTRGSVAEGCPEKMDREFIRWLLWEGRTQARRKKFKQIRKDFPDKTVWLKSRRQAKAWLNSLSAG